MEVEIQPDPKWSFARNVAFRFFFIFFILFIFFQNNGAYPLWTILMKYINQVLQLFIPWLGKHIFRLPYEITVFTNGSGDTTYDYIILLTILLFSLIGTILWSVLDRQRSHYSTLYYWLTVALRFYVGLMLINYGLVKIFKLQFPAPDLYRLTQTYGESSPMGLAWTFLGFSKGYNLFMGIAEIMAILLLFRRTMTAGAILTLVTTANVMAINYFYDVPVKILSTMLVMMTLFLLWNDASRLMRFFFSSEAVHLPIIKAPVLKKSWMQISKPILKFMVIAYALIFGFIQMLIYQTQYGDNTPKPMLYGIYSVETFIINNDTLPTRKMHALRWKQLLVEVENFAEVKYLNDSTSGFITSLDTVLHTINFSDKEYGGVKYSLSYSLHDSIHLHLSGMMGNDSVFMSMKRKGIKDFQLTKRGFNWINEYPYNR